MIDIIGVQLDLGASKKGVNMGPGAIRFAGLCDLLANNGIAFEDEGDLLPILGGKSLPNMHYYETINDLNARLFREVMDSLNRGMIPLVLGGDHSIAAGSASAVSTFYENIGIIWVDAHADFNDEKSTVTGNVHGMPLSALCGQGPNSMVAHASKICLINPKNAVIVGARDIDEAEWPRLQDAGVTVFTIDDVRKLGINNVMKKAIEIALEGTKGIHVSFDIDSMDPDVAPGVGTPVLNGFTKEEAYCITDSLKACGKILSVDMVEVNPILDIQSSTAKLACELILRML
ncbi:MAG: arginase [Bacillota bacterium]|nr:arginase [Bacillota bacterium]